MSEDVKKILEMIDEMIKENQAIISQNNDVPWNQTFVGACNELQRLKHWIEKAFNTTT